MKNITTYKEKFYSLLESTMGNVKPLISEGLDDNLYKTIANMNFIKKSPNTFKHKDNENFTITIMGDNIKISGIGETVVISKKDSNYLMNLEATVKSKLPLNMDDDMSL